MMKRLMTLLLVLVVVVGATATIGFAAGTETLKGNVGSKTITEDTELNLAGHSIGTLTVNPGVTVTISGAGTTGTITTVKGGGMVQLADEYMLWGSVDNKLTLDTAGISLRADELAKNGASVYYTSTFGGNADVLANIKAYGVALYVGSSKNLFADNTYTRLEKGGEKFAWKTDVATFNDNGVLLKGVLKTGNAYSTNKSNASKQVYNVPYVELADGTRITGSAVNRSLKDVVEQAVSVNDPGNDFWDKFTQTQKDNILNLYNAFSSFMSSWELGHLKPLVKPEAGDTYYIGSVADFNARPDVVGIDFELVNNIDFEGATINGLTGFAGSINGNGHTISNVTINGIGLVDAVASGETITDLHLRDVKVNVPSTATATAVGMIAGTNNGSITGVSATGSVKDTRANVAMGALVGNNKGTVTAAATITDNVVVSTLNTDGSGVGNNNTTYTTANLAAAVGLYNDAANVTKGLVGTGNVATNAASVYWRDSSYGTERQAQVFQNKRQTVVDYVFESGTMKWGVPSEIRYYDDQATNEKFENSWLSKAHIHNQKFVPGTTYIGIPYTHCSSSLEQAHYYMTQNSNGVYVLNSDVAKVVGGNKKSGNFLTGYTYSQEVGSADWESGNVGWAKYFGSDCSSALTVAWHQVSPILLTSKVNGGISLFYTGDIVPSEYNQYYYGVRQIGDYVVDDATMSDGKPLTGTRTVKDENGNVIKDEKGNNVTETYELTYTDLDGVTKKRYTVTSDKIVEKIGLPAVYDAYAQTQMGDILVSSGTAGHTRMAAIDPVVIRNGNGDIDPAKSYFVTHEQGDGLYERSNTNSSWRINYKYTFEQLAYQNLEGLTGSSGYYLPISMDAFHDSSVATTGGCSQIADAKGNKIINPASGQINSSFRIQYATVTVKDAAGDVKYEKTAYQGTSPSQNRRRAIPNYIPMDMAEFFSDYGTNLTNGQTYYFTVKATNFVDVTTTVVNNASFVYSAS